MDRMKQNVQIDQIAAHLKNRTPRVVRIILLSGLLPGAVTIGGMVNAEYYSHLYTKYLNLGACWLGFTSVFLGGTCIGLEAMRFHPTVHQMSSLYSGPFRLWFGFGHILMGIGAIYSAERESWQGLLGYLLGLGMSAIYSMSSSSRGFMPQWLSNIYWPWAIYCKILTFFLVYSLFNKEIHTLRMKKMQEDISKGVFKP